MYETQKIISLTLCTISLIIMGLLLGANLIKKYKSDTRQILSYICVFQILLLVLTVFQWFIGGRLEYLSIFKMSFVAIFFLAFVVYFCIHIYLLVSVKERFVLAGYNESIPKLLIIYPIVIIIVNTIIFISSLWTGFIYYFDEYGYEQYTSNYYIIEVMVFLFFIPDIFIIVKNRHKIDITGIPFTLLYWIIPIALFPVNILYNLDVSIISMTLFVLVIFISMDIRQGEIILEQETQIVQKEKEINDGRVNLLLSQIQPHFIFNTLNTIRYLVAKDPKRAENAIERFSKYLRYSMNSYSKTEMVPFENELETVQNYVFLEKERFGERLNVTYDIRDKDFEVPALCVQTIVENAVKHGVCQRIEGGSVNISACSTGDGYNIVVEDDGVGFDPDITPNDGRTHVGLMNTKERILIMAKGSLGIQSEIGKGTRITLWIPKKTSL